MYKFDEIELSRLVSCVILWVFFIESFVLAFQEGIYICDLRETEIAKVVKQHADIEK